MKLFGLGNKKTDESRAVAESEPVCTHPLTHLISMHDDPDHPDKITGMKCTMCGQRLPSNLDLAA